MTDRDEPQGVRDVRDVDRGASAVTSARDFVFMLDGWQGKGNLRPALDHITRLADRADSLETFLAEVRDGKHSLPGTLVQIKRLLDD